MQFDSSKNCSQVSKTPKSAFCKPIASPSTKQNRYENIRVDTDASDNQFWSCGKILEEADEDSVTNLTPRLDEEREREVNFLEEAQNMFLTQDTDKRNMAVYASKTTLETDEDSESNMTCTTATNRLSATPVKMKDLMKDGEHQLSLSILSSGSTNNDDSPTASDRKVPKLNFAGLRKSLGENSLNTSNMSTTQYSVNDSILEKRAMGTPNASFYIKSISKALSAEAQQIKQGYHRKGIQSWKGTSSQKKPVQRGLKGVSSQYFQTVINSVRKSSTNKSWKDSKTPEKEVTLPRDHWSHSKAPLNN